MLICTSRSTLRSTTGLKLTGWHFQAVLGNIYDQLVLKAHKICSKEPPPQSVIAKARIIADSIEDIYQKLVRLPLDKKSAMNFLATHVDLLVKPLRQMLMVSSSTALHVCVLT